MGDLGGHGRYCSLEKQLDCNDSVLLALEITEVEVDLPESGYALCIREAQQRGPGGEKNGKRRSPSGSPDATIRPPLRPVESPPGSRGSLRMRREDPSRTEELVRCVSLPTL